MFDAYGTLFDVHSAVGRLRAQVGAQADALSQLWRAKQLEYTWLRALMGAHADFWQVTGDALDYALARDRRRSGGARAADAGIPGAGRLPRGAGDAAPAARGRAQDRASFERRARGCSRPAAQSAGIDGMLDAILSVEEVGVFKPHPKVYQLAVDRLGVPAGSDRLPVVECLGRERRRDLWPACGMDQPPRACRRSACPAWPSTSFADLSGLPALLGL